MVEDVASEDSRGQMGLGGSGPRLTAVLLFCGVRGPEEGSQTATDQGLHLGAANQPCDLGHSLYSLGFICYLSFERG